MIIMCDIDSHGTAAVQKLYCTAAHRDDDGDDYDDKDNDDNGDVDK